MKGWFHWQFMTIDDNSWHEWDYRTTDYGLWTTDYGTWPERLRLKATLSIGWFGRGWDSFSRVGPPRGPTLERGTAPRLFFNIEGVGFNGLEPPWPDEAGGANAVLRCAERNAGQWPALGVPAGTARAFALDASDRGCTQARFKPVTHRRSVVAVRPRSERRSVTGFNHTRPLRSKNDEIAPTVAPPSVLRLSGIHHWTLVRSTVVPVCLRPGMVKKTPESEKLSSKFVLSGTLTIVAKALTQVAN